MPLLSIETNQALKSPAILKAVSGEIAAMLGKPERYVMLKYTHNPHMLMEGNEQPVAHLKLKSLGLPESRTAEFSNSLCELMQEHFSVAADRIYIEFSNPERHLWGWSGSTF